MNLLKELKLVFFITLIFGLSLLSCEKQSWFEGEQPRISVSLDTLTFDTVFTSIGSVTKLLKIFNKEKASILVDVYINQASNQFFRINVNGIKGPRVTDMEILPNDSIYVFVEVTIDPDQPLSNSPFIIEDELRVRSQKTELVTTLVAYGQNANYITPKKGKANNFLLTCEMNELSWDDAKPYVIYGRLFVDSCTVVIPAGARIYVHGGVARSDDNIYNDGMIIFLSKGRLQVNGAVDNPVIFQGDRLEQEFQLIKSQWAGILIWQGSENNYLNHVIIKNSVFGMRVDSASHLEMNSTTIWNTGESGLIGRHAKITANNCLFYENSQHAVQLAYGGDYTFNYCTITNYFGKRSALSINNIQCGDQFCMLDLRRYNEIKANFTNCIIVGNDDDEVDIDLNYNYMVDISFDHCALVTKELLKDVKLSLVDRCKECIYINRQDRLFLDRVKNNFLLDTMSVVRSKGIPIPSILVDIRNNVRKTAPDMGCFEF